MRGLNRRKESVEEQEEGVGDCMHPELGEGEMGDCMRPDLGD